MGRNEGRSQNSGGIGLLPLHSNTPSIYNLRQHCMIRVNYQQIVIISKLVKATRLDSNLQYKLFLDTTLNVISISTKKWSYRKPSLSPRRYVCYTTMIKDPLSCSCTSIVLTTIRSFPKHTHTNVAEYCAEHDAMSLDVKSPPTIFILIKI
jgi:hypothetical protein